MDGHRSLPRWLRPAAMVTLALAIAASLSGCFGALHAAQTLVAPRDMSNPRPLLTPSGSATSPNHPHAAIRAAAAQVTMPLGFHAGDGTVSTRAGDVTGNVNVVATTHGGFMLKVSNYRPVSSSQLHVYASPVVVDPTQTCMEPSPLLRDLGVIGRGRAASLSLSTDAAAFPRGDPSFLKGLWFIDPDRASISCGFPVATTATLVWRLPDMNPGLEPIDNGLQAGALGQIDGAPQTPAAYTAAEGDSWSGVATRFAITVSDLRWLNPVSDPERLTSGETVNLAPANR